MPSSCSSALPRVYLYTFGAIVNGLQGYGRHATPALNPTASLILHSWALAGTAAARTTWQGAQQGACEADAQSGDGVRHMALRAQRQRLWVDNRRERQIAGRARRGMVLRGEWSPSRRPGIRRPRCRDWRDGGSRAIRGPRNDRARPPASGRDSRARSASGAWSDRPGARMDIGVAAWKPVVVRLGLALRPLDQQPLFGCRFAAVGVIMRRPHPQRAKREIRACCCPSRQLICCQASSGSPKASALTETG